MDRLKMINQKVQCPSVNCVAGTGCKLDVSIPFHKSQWTVFMNKWVLFYLLLIMCGLYECSKSHPEATSISQPYVFQFDFPDAADRGYLTMSEILTKHSAKIAIWAETGGRQYIKLNRLDKKNVENYASFNGRFKVGNSFKLLNFRLFKNEKLCYVHFAIFFNRTRPMSYKSTSQCDSTEFVTQFQRTEHPSKLKTKQPLVKQVQKKIEQIVRRFNARNAYDTYLYLNYKPWLESEASNSSRVMEELHFMINCYFASYQIMPGVQLILERVYYYPPSKRGHHILRKTEAIDVESALPKLHQNFDKRNLEPPHIGLFITHKPMHSRLLPSTAVLARSSKRGSLFLTKSGVILITTDVYDTQTLPHTLYLVSITNQFAREVLHLFGASDFEEKQTIMSKDLIVSDHLLVMSPVSQFQIFSIYQRFFNRTCPITMLDFCKRFHAKY